MGLLIPFNTHGGSGFSNNIRTIAQKAPLEVVPLSVTIGNRVISAELDDSVIAKEFAELLPQSISF